MRGRRPGLPAAVRELTATAFTEPGCSHFARYGWWQPCLPALQSLTWCGVSWKNACSRAGLFWRCGLFTAAAYFGF